MVEYEDGSKHCFACGSTWFPEHMRGKTYEKPDVEIKPIELPKLDYVALQSKGITAETCRKYGVGVDPLTRKLWQVHYVNGQPTGAKLKWYGDDGKKRFSWVGDKNIASMYGLHVAGHKFKLIITEGELDALAAHQMTGWAAISVPFGSTSVEQYIRQALPLIERVETIYVCMDMDEPGRAAHDIIMKLLTPGKAREVFLPAGFKDACDMLAAGKEKEFKDALFAAQPRIPSGIMTAAQVKAEALDFATNRDKRVGISFGIPTLDKIFGGFRPGELSGWIADTGVGKSTVCRQLMFNLAEAGFNSLYIPLEDVAPVSALQMASLVMGKALITSEEITDLDELGKALDFVTEHVTFLNQIGTMTVTDLVQTVEFAVRASSVKVVVLDHITALAEGAAESATSMADKCIAELRKVARTHMVHVAIVSHIKKPQNAPKKGKVRPTLALIKHASSIPQACNFVVGMDPNPHERNLLELFVLKGARTFQSETDATFCMMRYDRATTRLLEHEVVTVDVEAYTTEVEINGSTTVPEEDAGDDDQTQEDSDGIEPNDW